MLYIQFVSSNTDLTHCVSLGLVNGIKRFVDKMQYLHGMQEYSVTVIDGNRVLQKIEVTRIDDCFCCRKRNRNRRTVPVFVKKRTVF